MPGIDELLELAHEIVKKVFILIPVVLSIVQSVVADEVARIITMVKEVEWLVVADGVSKLFIVVNCKKFR